MGRSPCGQPTDARTGFQNGVLLTVVTGVVVAAIAGLFLKKKP